MTYQDLLWYVDMCPPDSCCWEWRGAVNDRGYGLLNHRRAHRLTYEFFKGKVPDGLVLDHLCRNKSCVNPGHLEPVRQAVNLARGNRHRRNHCPSGHPYSGTNLKIRSNRTGRECKSCQSESFKNWKNKKRAQNHV